MISHATSFLSLLSAKMNCGKHSTGRDQSKPAQSHGEKFHHVSNGHHIRLVAFVSPFKKNDCFIPAFLFYLKVLTKKQRMGLFPCSKNNCFFSRSNQYNIRIKLKCGNETTASGLSIQDFGSSHSG